ncbi:bifunctional DedA family/phosphatase PAP2 family protein [Candidatus Sororendozoicomonas aggregata]|uniref:bifunctional DedA family/phosphatase PAP2 family protein n=1 Tax=Candidatus Sororendozoicomonas aggregata TaxID=3073239 RepID=UPI002ED4DD4D
MFLPSFETVHAWLQLNNEWLGPTIAFMALIESLVVVGLLVPGVPIMFALGAMAGAGAIDPVSMLVWGIIGAVIGDGISFQLGYHYHQKVRSWWPFYKHPQWLAKGEDFFHNHGDLSIALGRFIGPVRPVVPVVAGMLDMSPKRFYIVNILSAIPWAPVYLMPGFLAGAAIQTHGTVPVAFFSLIVVFLIKAIVIPALAIWLSWRFKISTLLKMTIGMLLVLLGILTAMECLGYVSFWNQEVNQWVTHLKMPYLDKMMTWATWLGSLSVLLIPGGLWVIGGLHKNCIHKVVTFLVSFIGLEVSLWSMKWLIDSPRPSVSLYGDPFSFPSGHTAQATFFLLWFGIASSKKLAYVPRVLLLSTSLMMIFLVAFSRLVLQAHWMSDVIAGFLLGALWLCMALFYSYKK